VRKVVLLAIALAVASGSPAHAAELQPDLDMRSPWRVQLTTDGAGRSFVAFASEVDNQGPGVLKVVGRRDSTATDTMSATQVLLDTNSVATGTVARTVPDAGTMQYSPAGGHDHWHYLHFEDYNLLSVPDLNFVAPTRKTGFCLVVLNLAFNCGSTDTGLLQIGDPAEAMTGAAPAPDTQAMGLIAPDGPDFNGNRERFDIYDPTVEGQDIEITGVPDGRYCLSYVVNPEGRLVEANAANNGASVLVDVGTAAGGHTLNVGDAFEESATCGLTRGAATSGPGTVDPGTVGPETVDPVVPPLSMRKATQLTRAALEQKFRRPTRLSRACRLTTANHASCRVAFVQSRTRYRGRVGIKQVLRAGEWKWFYAIDVKRTGKRVRTKTLLGGVLGVNAAAARRVLSLPAGVPAERLPGTAWPERWLTPAARATLAQRKPIG